MLALHEEVPEAWVEDHERFELVPLLGATLIRAPTAETPMASGLVAFADASAAAAFARSVGGEVVTLEALLRNPQRFAAARSTRGDAAEHVTTVKP